VGNKTVYYFFNIVSLFFLVFGILETMVALTSFIGTVTGMIGAATADALGKESGGFPFFLGFGGSLYFGFLGVLYLAASVGLYKGKKWTHFVIGTLGIVGLIDASLSLSSLQPKYYEFGWVLFYFLLVFLVLKNKPMFRK